MLVWMTVLAMVVLGLTVQYLWRPLLLLVIPSRKLRWRMLRQIRGRIVHSDHWRITHR